ncbi:MAG: hypothetical protein ACT4QD_02935 [Acidobacteriota bacterium]
MFDFLSNQVSKLPAQPMHGDLDRALGQAEPFCRTRITAARLIASQILLEDVELARPRALRGLLAQTRNRPVEQRHGPSPVEEALWRFVSGRLDLKASFRCLELQ